MKYRRFLVILLFSAMIVANLAAQVILKTEFQDTQPKFVSNPDGTYSGLCLDIMHLIEKNSDFRFEYARFFVPINRITKDLEEGKIDVYFGLVKTAEREKAFVFLSELFSTRYQILARRDDPVTAYTVLHQLQAARIPIMVIKGSGSAFYFESLSGLQFVDGPTAVENCLRRLKAGDVRLFGYYDLGNDFFLDSFKFHDSLVALKIPFDSDQQWLCIGRNLDPQIANRLQGIIAKLKKTAEWQTIMQRYFPGSS